MKDYKSQIKECVQFLKLIRFPCEDWKEDKKYFDHLEEKFSKEANDEETAVLLKELRDLIKNKRMDSLNRNKTSEELYAGWNED